MCPIVSKLRLTFFFLLKITLRFMSKKHIGEGPSVSHRDYITSLPPAHPFPHWWPCDFLPCCLCHKLCWRNHPQTFLCTALFMWESPRGTWQEVELLVQKQLHLQLSSFLLSVLHFPLLRALIPIALPLLLLNLKSSQLWGCRTMCHTVYPVCPTIEGVPF